VTPLGPWLRCYSRAADDRPRLVALPHAGGTAGFYRPLSAACAGRLQVAAVQYPGRLDRIREAPVPDLQVLADRVTAALLALPPRPTALLGHSMGAMLAFEIARRLEATGQPPERLFVSACGPPPTRPGPEIPPDDAQLLSDLVTLGGTDPQLLRDEEFLRQCLPAMRADLVALTRYWCARGTVVGCAITALAGDADPRTATADVAAWRTRTTGGFALRVFPGGHFYLADHFGAVGRLVAASVTGPATSRLSGRTGLSP
jgi:surfactin synthase thioesterase subunit